MGKIELSSTKSLMLGVKSSAKSFINYEKKWA